MIPVDQTIDGWPRGNCLMACVASLLEEPLSAFPDLYTEGTRRGDPERWWWGILLEALAQRGRTVTFTEGEAPRGYAIGSVVRPGLPGHAVVALDGVIVHDPHPARAIRGPYPPIQHWYVITDLHDTDGLGCWCAPSYLLPCDECEGDGCWKCVKGAIPLTRAEAEAAPRAIVVVHNR